MEKIKAIYAIKDKRNDKVIYIGQTKNFNHRKSNHFRCKITPIDKYMFDEGRDNFVMYILEELFDTISIEEMRNKEQYYIEKYNTIKNGLNKRFSGSKEFQKEHLKEHIKEYRKTEKYKEIQRESNKKWYQKQKEKNLI